MGVSWRENDLKDQAGVTLSEDWVTGRQYTHLDFNARGGVDNSRPPGLARDVRDDVVVGLVDRINDCVEVHIALVYRGVFLIEHVFKKSE